MRKPLTSMDSLVGLVAVAEAGDWEKAGDELGVTVSALRKRIKQIADMVGAPVLEPFGDGAKLTEMGELFYRDAITAIEHAVLAEEKARAHLLLRQNRLLVGHSTYLAPRLLEAIRDLTMDRPGVQIEHRTGMTADMVERVVNGTLHAGFGFLPTQRKGLLIRQVLEEPLVACIPSELALARRSEIRPQDLDTERFIAVGRDALPALHAEIEEYFESFGIKLHVVADALSASEALTCVEQKVGICLLAASSVSPRRGVTVRPLATRALTRRSGLFLRDDNRDVLIAELMETVLQRTALFSRLASKR